METSQRKAVVERLVLPPSSDSGNEDGIELVLHRRPREGATRDQRRGHNSSPQIARACVRADTTTCQIWRNVGPRSNRGSRLRHQSARCTAVIPGSPPANERRRGDCGAPQRIRLQSGPPHTSSRRCDQSSTTTPETVCHADTISREHRRRIDRPRRHKDVPPLDLSSLHLDSDDDRSDRRKGQSGSRNRRGELVTPLLRRFTYACEDLRDCFCSW